jgi:hypothetical protein
MAARKKASSAAKGRLLSESKVTRVLEGMGVDAKKFLREYAADRGRGPRGLSDAAATAAERFLRDGDMAALKSALRTKHDATAAKTVAKYVQSQKSR